MPDITQDAIEGLKQRLAEAGLADVTVSIGKGSTNKRVLGDADGKLHDEITIRLQGQSLESDPNAKQKIYAALKTSETLGKHIQFDEAGEHLDSMRAQLESFIGKGAKIDLGYVKWGGFDKELNAKNRWSETRDHAVAMSGDGFGFGLYAPETEEAKAKEKPDETLGARTDANINGRIDDIKALLIERLGGGKEPGYLNAQDEAAKTEIKEAVANLTIESKNGGESITIRSPQEKAEAERKRDPKAEPLSAEAQKELNATNILSRLTGEQLGKALGRAFLHGGAKADEIFPAIAGREDMSRAISRQLKILKYSEAGKQDPELGKSIDAFLADDIFKKQDYGAEKGSLRKSPVFEKLSDPDKTGTVTVTLSLPEKTADTALAEFAPKEQKTSAEPQPANDGILAQASAPAADIAKPEMSVAMGAMQTPASPALLSAVNEKAPAIALGK